MGILIPLILVFFCCLFIWRACDGFERASDYIGRNLSEGVRGGTINAISSSVPELFTTMIALFVLSNKDGFAIGIGTTAGSALFNGMIIPAVCILAVIGVSINGTVRNSVDVSTKVILRDGLFLIAAEFLLIMSLGGTQLVWWQGFALMSFYVIYMSYMLMSMKSDSSEEDDDEEEEDDEDDDEAMGPVGKIFYWLSLGPVLDLESRFIKEKQEVQIKKEEWNGWPLLLTSTAVIGIACWLLVDACKWLGTGSVLEPSYELFGYELVGMGLPPLFVAVIFASMATSVPDTIISVRDAKKGEADDAVANALGSNIFDICFALGFPLFLYTLVYGPIQMNQETVDQSGELRMSLLILTVIAFFIYFIGRRDRSSGVPRISLKKGKAMMLFSLYAVYIIYVIGRGNDAAWAQPITDFLRQLLVGLPVFT